MLIKNIEFPILFCYKTQMKHLFNKNKVLINLPSVIYDYNKNKIIEYINMHDETINNFNKIINSQITSYNSIQFCTDKQIRIDDSIYCYMFDKNKAVISEIVDKDNEYLYRLVFNKNK